MHRRSNEAKADLLNIWIRLHDEAGERIADSQIDAITERFYLLADYPEMGRDRSDEWGLGRRSLVAGEYVIVYRIDDGDVIILRVFHGRQDIDSVLI